MKMMIMFFIFALQLANASVWANPIISENLIISPKVYSVDATDEHGNYLFTTNVRNVEIGFTLSTNPIDWGLELDWGNNPITITKAEFNLLDVFPNPFGSWFPVSFNDKESFGSSMPEEIYLYKRFGIIASGDYSYEGAINAFFLFEGFINFDPDHPEIPIPPIPVTYPYQTQIELAAKEFSVEVPPFVPAPEPSSITLLGLGLAGLSLVRLNKCDVKL